MIITPSKEKEMERTGFKAIFMRSVLQIVRRPIYWAAFFALPLFIFFLMADLMKEGLPYKVPAAIVDRDGSSMSRQISQTIGGMQLVDVTEDCNSFTQARHQMQEGKIFGYFLIPENFQQDLLSGRKPVVTFYTNMTYFIPASMLLKTFQATALYTKSGVTLNVLESVGATEDVVTPLLLPVNVQTRAVHNPELSYPIYLCNSFIPCALQLMIFLITCFSLGQEVKYGTSVKLMRMARGSVLKAVAAKLLPQTIIWIVVAIFMESWLFGFNGYPMRGSWFWITLSEVMFVLAAQGMALFFYCVLPNLRLALSISALLGVLSFSLAAFSFPVESMYPAMGIFSWILPTRYNFLIYIDQALNGIDIYYSRIWFVAYIIFMLLPFTMMWRLKKAFLRPAYVK